MRVSDGWDSSTSAAFNTPFSQGNASFGCMPHDFSPHPPGYHAPEPEYLLRSVTAPAVLESRVFRKKVKCDAGKYFTAREHSDQLVVSWSSRMRQLTKTSEDRALIRKPLMKLPVWASPSDAEVDGIIDCMAHFTFCAGESLMAPGDAGKCFFVVHAGHLEVSVEGQNARFMGRGDSFGGWALLSDSTDPTTIVAKEDSSVWAIDAISFRGLCATRAQKRDAENRCLLDGIRLFDGLSVQQKARVGETALHTEVHEAGTRILTQGDEPTMMYSVKAGLLGVFSARRKANLACAAAAANAVAAVDAGTPLENGIEASDLGCKVAQLGAGNSFGKGAAICGKKTSSVSVVTETRCELVCIDTKELKEVLGDDLAKVLDISLVFTCLEQSPFISQFSVPQKLHIARATQISEYHPGEPIGEDDPLEFVIVVSGRICKRSGTEGELATPFLEHGQLREMESFSHATNQEPLKRYSSRRLRISSGSCSSVGDFDELVAGPLGAKIATLTQESLSIALREVGISRSTDEVVEHARATLLARKVPIFHHLSDEQIDSLVQSFILVELERSAIVFEQGLAATDFWVIAKGEVEEVVDDQQVAIIGKGGHFGIHSLLFHEPRRSTVRVLSQYAVLWQLEGETFDSIITGNIRQEMVQHLQLRTADVELKDLRHMRKIGEGGFASVRSVVHRHAQLRYALKRVRKQNEEVTALVSRECALLAELDHPLILQLVKTFETRKSFYILTELLTGGDLLDALDRIGKPLDRAQTQFYTGSLVLALEFLHGKNIVYRDLKPENVMLDGQGYTKLIDFGTAKKLDDDQARTYTLVGSHHFMAPEIIRGRGYGTEVDIWSLGVMMFEFVCGYLPFGRDIDSSRGMEILKASQVENLIFAKFYYDSCGKSFIREMLRKEPERRFGTDVRGYERIRDHEFFIVERPGTLFDRIIARQLLAPYLPTGELPLSSDGSQFSDC